MVRVAEFGYNNAMKKTKIMFWVATGIIVLMEGVMPGLTFQTEMAKQGIAHLGYPEYFGVMLAMFKVLGALALAIPQVPVRVKEWAYAGFGIDFIAAFVSIWAVDGFGGSLLLPIIAMALLAVSYVNGEKVRSEGCTTAA